MLDILQKLNIGYLALSLLITKIKSSNIKDPKNNNDYVGKMILPQDSLTEWKNAKKLFKMDPLQEYFIYPLQVCENIPIRTSSKCHLIKKGQKLHALYMDALVYSTSAH